MRLGLKGLKEWEKTLCLGFSCARLNFSSERELAMRQLETEGDEKLILSLINHLESLFMKDNEFFLAQFSRFSYLSSVQNRTCFLHIDS